MQYVT
jgi:hypothetical protein